MAATLHLAPELKLETETTEKEICVRCTGRITAACTTTLQNAVRSLIPETKRLVLDLTDVNFIDSSGLGALVSVALTAKRQDCELKLVNLTQQGKELLRITNLASALG